jgi:hypothetical protein
MKRYILILFLMLCLPAAAFSWGEEEDVGTIAGRMIQSDGAPLSGAMVFLFNAATGPAPTLGKYWRVPDILGETDDTGRFSIQALQGKYYVGAIRRMSDMHPMGPPVSGDYVYPSHADEVKGRQKAYRVLKWENTDIGTIKGILPFDKERHMYKGTVTAISGTVMLPDGKPAEHAIVFAYDSVEMQGNPRYASDPSGPDGKYILRVGKPGTYYLRVRGLYGGGQPAAGALMGGTPAGVRVTAGKTVSGIDISSGIFAGPGAKAN